MAASKEGRAEVPVAKKGGQWGPRRRTSARVAQLVEHTLGKGEVTGSIPVASFRWDQRGFVRGLCRQPRGCDCDWHERINELTNRIKGKKGHHGEGEI